MQRFYDRLDKALTAALLALVVAMVLSITAEIVLNAAIQPVASRLIEALSDPATPAAEAPWSVRFLEGVVSVVAKASAPVNTTSQTLLVWIGILGSALAFRYRAHLGVDALVRLYPRRVRLVLDYVSTALVGLFSLAILGIGGALVCYRAFSLGSKMPGYDIFNINRGWFYIVLVLTGLLNLLYCIYHFAHPRPVEDAPHSENEDATP